MAGLPRNQIPIKQMLIGMNEFTEGDQIVGAMTCMFSAHGETCGVIVFDSCVKNLMGHFKFTGTAWQGMKCARKHLAWLNDVQDSDDDEDSEWQPPRTLTPHYQNADIKNGSRRER